MTRSKKDRVLVALGADPCWILSCRRRATREALHCFYIHGSTHLGLFRAVVKLCSHHHARPPLAHRYDLMMLGAR